MNIVLTIMMFCSPIYWDELSVQEKIAALQDMEIEAVVLEVYHGNRDVSDDDYTFDLLSLLVNKDDNATPYTQALKFNVLNTIVKKSDGALAEVMYEYLIPYCYDNSVYVLSYLKKHQDLAKRYIDLLSFEFALREERVYNHDCSLTQFEKKLLSAVGADTEYAKGFLQSLRDGVSTWLVEFANERRRARCCDM